MARPQGVGVYALDVGQGDCTFVLGPDEGTAVLFDCRDDYVAQQFVKDYRITRLVAAIASHLDLDHIRGMLPFLRWFLRSGGKVDSLYTGPDQKPDPDLRKAAYLFLKQAVDWDEAGVIPMGGSLRDGMAPKRVWSGDGWAVDIVLPRHASLVRMRLENGEQPNRCSAVLRVSMGDRAVLVGGDATLDSWERLEDRLLAAEVFRIPHHGGDIEGGDIEEGDGTWKIADLYDRVAPRAAIVSVGTNNRYGHPDPRFLPIAAASGVSCRLLCTQLTSRCHADPQEHRARAVENATLVGFPYRHLVHKGDPSRRRAQREVPCAGSIAVWLRHDGVQVDPAARDWHDDFVTLLDRPQCRPTGNVWWSLLPADYS